MLAPAALILFSLALFVVLATSGGGGDSSSRNSEAAPRDSGRGETTAPRPRRRGGGAGRSSYTVQAGDTLAGIAEKSGVEVEQLQEMNPALDPQALVSGQKIKLRE